MSDIDLKSRYDIGWFSAYDTLKGMVVLYGYSKVLEALMEIGNLTPHAADGVCTCHFSTNGEISYYETSCPVHGVPRR